MNQRKFAFTLIEMLATIAIIALLAGLLLPAFSRARDSSKTLTCQTRFREVARGWQIYADENDGAIVFGRMAKVPDDPSTPKNENYYNVGNGLKNRPRWLAIIAGEIGIPAFNKPEPNNERQDYDNEVYQCPEVSTWVDERNHPFGYNYQFLGNARMSNNRFINFPVILSQIKATGGTVIAADAMGTAAAFSSGARGSYANDPAPNRFENMANHAWSLDPPRLTDKSDRGEGIVDTPTTPRSAVDPRHRGKTNAVFVDGHAEAKTPVELGYRMTTNGCFANEPDADCEGTSGGGTGASTYSPSDERLVRYRVQGAPPGDDGIDWANNRFFSGTGKDDDPPELP